MGDAGIRGAVEWLVSAAPDPASCRVAWERDLRGLTLLPAGEVWDVLFVGGLLGWPTLRVLGGLVDRPGPVIADIAGTSTGFFVPPGTAAGWIGTGVRGAGPGTWVAVPYPGRSTGVVRWLVSPDGSGVLTDPAVLETALHEAAAELAADGL
jgi:hypothetical protein